MPAMPQKRQFANKIRSVAQGQYSAGKAPAWQLDVLNITSYRADIDRRRERLSCVVGFSLGSGEAMDADRNSSLDREIIILAAAWDLIGSMVHYAHFTKEHRIENAILMFQTREASKLFLIILADLLSLPRDGTFGLGRPRGEGSLGQTYLGHLLNVASVPSFKGDVTLLTYSVKSFAEWLDGFADVQDVWLPSIERNGTLRVRRMDYLKICGTISKHGFTRLGDVVGKLRMILAANSTEIDEGQSYLVIPEFQEWFQDNIFIASSTRVAWHLNEIRWGIYHYLVSELRRAYIPTEVISGAQMYSYDVPREITDPLVRSMFWDLMNNMRAPPYFPRFTVDRYMWNLY